MVVTDTGPGVPQGAVDQVFARGYSTKSTHRGRRSRHRAGAGPDDLRAPRRLGERAQRRRSGRRRRDRRRVHRGARPRLAATRRRPPTRSGWRRRGAATTYGVLVVDDDFMVAKIHSRFLAGQPGFRVVGVAHNGADALAAVAALRPDLILLDVHLPDMSGLDVLREARQRHPEVDVILVTAAHELDVVRQAWQGGALSYLVKPFEYEALAQRLEHFRSNRAMLAAPDVDQGQIDQLFGVAGAVRGPTPAELPKGLSRETAELVRRALSADEPLSATECADRVGLSRVSARRYLAHLEETGVATVQLKYGRTGRPERLYRLR